MTQCATCGEADALLFTCSHCDGEFCADHQFPHHACEKFTARSATERAVDWAWGGGDGSAADSATDADAGSPAAGPDPGPAGDAAAGTDAGPAGAAPTATGPDRAQPEGAGTAGTPPEIEPIARDAAKERRPDRQGPTPPPPGRGFPSDRHDDRTVVDWIREQSYPGYVAKVGSLSLLFTLSYYGGLVAVL